MYYKSPTMHDVDDGIGDIQGKITDKQVQQYNTITCMILVFVTVLLT